jgi:ATP-dependent HslUV protease ATP-binding subunit HslU
LEDILFEVPDKMPESKIKITGAMVNEKLDSIVKNRDLSKYIL